MKKINSFEYETLIWFLIRACFITASSSLIIEIAEEEALLSIIIGILLGIIPFVIYEYFKHKYPSKNIIEINQKLFGKFSNIINFIIFLTIFIFTIITFWMLTNFINTQFLYKTPFFVIGLALIIPVAYINLKGLKVIGKVSLLSFYISFVFIILILSGIISGIYIDNIKPFFVHTPNQILYASLIFLCFNVLPIFLLTIIPKNQITKYSSKKNFLFYILAGLSLLNVIFMTITIFGIGLSKIYEYPCFEILKRVSILDIIDRVESILVVEWILALFILISVAVYFLKMTFIQTFTKFKNSKKKGNYFTIVASSLLLIISSCIFQTNGEELTFFKGPFIYLSLIVFIVIPIIMLIKSKFSS